MIRWLFLVLVGCGRLGFDPLGDAGGSGSGTRLQQVWYVYENGPRLPETLFDTLLGERCDPLQTTSDLRCLPRAAAQAQYADAACTQPVAQTTGVEHFAYDSFYPPFARVYGFGAMVATPAQTYVLQYDGSCAIESGTPTGTWYALTDAPFAMFARLTPMFGSEGRLVSQALVADDGFRTPGPLHDTQVGADCSANELDDATVCEVYPADLAEFYTDSSCSHVVEDAYVPVSFGFQFVNQPICKTTDLRVLPVTTELAHTTPVWLEIPGSMACVMATVGTGRRLFDLGAPFSLAPVTRQPITSTRIQPIEDSAGAAHADEYSTYDSQLGFECTPALAADGQLRCLPSRPAYAQPLFTDAACTQPIRLAPYGQPACAKLPPLIIADYVGMGSATVLHIYQPGAKYTGSPLYTMSGASCIVFTPNSDLYAEAAELPPSAFSAVTEQTGP